MRKPGAPLLASLALALASCGGGSTTPSAPVIRTISGTASPVPTTSHDTIDSADIPPFGAILVNDDGESLYIFERDEHRRVTCTAGCQSMWPPLKPVSVARPIVGGQVKPSLLGSDKNPAGGRVITYDGWPLYTYAQRSFMGYVAEPPRTTAGQGLDSYGGHWYLISPSGTAITKTGRPPLGVSYPSGA